MIGNLDAPHSDGQQPSLLSFSQAVTLFHEFGHVVHCVCTGAYSETDHTDSKTTSFRDKAVSLSDIERRKKLFSLFSWSWDAAPWPGGVEGDFLEAPSQMLENWLYDSTILSRLSRHYQTKQPLPEGVVKKLVSMRFHLTSVRYQRLIFMSLYDLLIHAGPSPYSIPSSGPSAAASAPDHAQEKYNFVTLWGALQRK
jgi:hypothetical protein